MTDDTAKPLPTQQRSGLDDEISLWEVLAVLLRRRWTIAGTTVAMTALAIATLFIGDDTFTTSAQFRPQSGDGSGTELLALASQFGVNVGGGGVEEASPAFYAELLTSRAIFSVVAPDTYDVEGVGTTTLADLLEIEEDTEELRQERVHTWLAESAVSVSTSRETGTLTLEVVTRWPDLSYALADRLLAELTRFNMEVRQSQAAAERTFISKRVEEAQAELLVAETSLRQFLESNRLWQDAPLLVFQHDRLQREVLRKNSVLETLLQSLEQASIQEVRDTPVITVIQEPFLPPGPDDSSLLLRAALGIVLGGMAGIVLAFVVEAVRRPAAGDPGREDFQRSWDAFRGSIPFVGRKA
jgi:uncharacterized protein involved in exopolysaccharide biosynthesis